MRDKVGEQHFIMPPAIIVKWNIIKSVQFAEALDI